MKLELLGNYQAAPYQLLLETACHCSGLVRTSYPFRYSPASFFIVMLQLDWRIQVIKEAILLTWTL